LAVHKFCPGSTDIRLTMVVVVVYFIVLDVKLSST